MQQTQNVKILIVGDEQTVRQYLAKRFIKEGFTVKTCCSYEEAMEAASKENFDIAIIDLKTSGINISKIQKGLTETQNLIQFIIFTEEKQEKNILDEKIQNATIYFPKPIEYGSLVNTILDLYKYKLRVQQSKSK